MTNIRTGATAANPGNLAAEGDDLIEVGPGHQTTVIDGGEGYDTVVLVPTAEPGGTFFSFGRPESFRNIEAIQGSAASEEIMIDAATLSTLQRISGGGGTDWVNVTLSPINAPPSGIVYDLSDTEFVGVNLSIFLFPSHVPLTLKLRDKEAALSTHISKKNTVTIDFSGTDVVFTAAERNRLFANGIDTLVDASGTYRYVPASLGLTKEEYVIRPDHTGPLTIDAGQNAVFTGSAGGGTLEVTSATGTFGFLANGPVAVQDDGSGVRSIMVDPNLDDGIDHKIKVGELTQLALGWQIVFNELADQLAIERVVTHLTVEPDAPPAGEGVYEHVVTTRFTDVGNQTTTYSTSIKLVPQDAVLLDPNGHASPATDGDDYFVAPASIFRENYSLTGGAGTDTLYLEGLISDFQIELLAEFSGIERIVFDRWGGFLYITAAQLADVREIVSDTFLFGDIVLTGPDRSTFDFRGITLTGNYALSPVPQYATVAISDVGQILDMLDAAEGLRVHLAGGILTADERAQLYALGALDVRDDSDDGEANAAPVVNGLEGDVVRAAANQAAALDLGADASLSDNMRIRKLTVSIAGGAATDELDIATSGILRLIDGMAEGGRIADWADGSLVTFGHLYDVTNTSFEILFNGEAKQDRIDALVQALTYTYKGEAEHWRRQITISASDGADKTTTATVTAASLTDPAPPTAPTALTLAGSSVREFSRTASGIGTFSATDPNTGDTLTYTLLNDAGGRFTIQGNRLLVANGVKLDFEQAQSHMIRVKVTDSHQLSTEATFRITVRDVAPENVAGSARADVIKGGRDSDWIHGRSGDDTLHGGKGHDTLRGDAGKDVFVFDSGLGRTNVDKILSYSTRYDSIWLDNKVFTKLVGGSLENPVRLAKRAFWTGDRAHDADDRIIYNKNTGTLFYDPDGTGAKAAIQFATLSKGLNLASEFWVV